MTSPSWCRYWSKPQEVVAISAPWRVSRRVSNEVAESAEQDGLGREGTTYSEESLPRKRAGRHEQKSGVSFAPNPGSLAAC
jgi:hypothetical protein